MANGEECDLTANDLAASQGDEQEEAGKLGAAVSFLKSELSGGRVEQSAVKKDANASGISWASVRRAKDRLKIKPVKIGKVWFWQPPAGYEDTKVIEFPAPDDKVPF